MDLRTALRTTGTVRGFTDQPVDDALLVEILDDARFAPSGGNKQPWRVAVVGDQHARSAIAAAMRPVWEEYVATSAAGQRPFVFGLSVDGIETTPVPNTLIDDIASVPVVLAVAADLNQIALMDGQLGRPPITGGASIYPFCWNLLLSARAHGLGGVLTTFLSRREPEVAEVLGLPDRHALAATIFLGHPVHQPTRLTRRPVSTFATRDRFDGEPLSGS
ncbi:MAG: nitroreductase family protein [Ilumatobacteraceae bacterium]|jgi:nitroreductase